MKESEVEIINEGGFSILTEEEMKELVYENGSTPNPYFLTEQDGGAFHYSVFEELKFTLAKKTKKYFIVKKKDNKITGIVALEQSPRTSDAGGYWVKFVNVAKEFQEQGYARKLVAGMFTHAKNEHVHLIGSSRTALGEDRLASLIEEYAKKFNVRYISATEYQ